MSSFWDDPFEGCLQAFAKLIGQDDDSRTKRYFRDQKQFEINYDDRLFGGPKFGTRSARRGSILCTGLAGLWEHSGVYLGKGRIAELNSTGLIQAVSPKQFLCYGGGYEGRILIACQSEWHVHESETVARRAEEFLGSNRDYHMIMDNCHQFTSGCITGKTENIDNAFWMLEDTIRSEFCPGGSFTWEPADFSGI